MPKLTERQKVWAVFAMSSLAAVGIFLTVRSIQQSGEEIAPLTILATENPAYTDSDGDGVTDQEETEIFKTDPQNTDTDGDGAEDGIEIAFGSDPSKSEIPEIVSRLAAADARGETNATELFLTEFSSRLTEKAYVYTPTSAESLADFQWGIAPGDIESIVASLESPLGALVPQVTVRDDEIRVSADTSREAVLAYLGRVSEILDPVIQEKLAEGSESPLAVLELLKKNLLPALETADAGLPGVTVPRNFQDVHKEFVQLVRLEVATLRDLNGRPDDAVANYISFHTFARTLDGWVNVQRKLATRLEGEGIALPKELAAKFRLPAAS